MIWWGVTPVCVRVHGVWSTQRCAACGRYVVVWLGVSKGACTLRYHGRSHLPWSVGAWSIRRVLTGCGRGCRRPPLCPTGVHCRWTCDRRGHRQQGPCAVRSQPVGAGGNHAPCSRRLGYVVQRAGWCRPVQSLSTNAGAGSLPRRSLMFGVAMTQAGRSLRCWWRTYRASYPAPVYVQTPGNVRCGVCVCTLWATSFVTRPSPRRCIAV